MLSTKEFYQYFLIIYSFSPTGKKIANLINYVDSNFGKLYNFKSNYVQLGLVLRKKLKQG